MKKWLAWELARNDKSLSGFWPLIENEADYSGNGYHLQTSANAELASKKSYRPNSAIYHVSVFESVSNNAGALDCWFNPEEKFTISGWIFPEAESNSIVAMCAKDTNNGSWQGWKLTANAINPIHNYTAALEFIFSNNYKTSKYYINYAPSNMVTLSPYSWHHFAMVWDGTKGVNNTQILFFIDGIEAGSVNPIQPYGTNWTWTSNNRVPRLSVGGSIVDVVNNISVGYSTRCLRIYRRKLSHTEIIEIMNRELDIDGFQTRSLNSEIALYSFPYYDSVYLNINSAQPPGISGGGPSDSVPLYIANIENNDSAIDLFLNAGNNVTGILPLYIYGNDSIYNSIPLYISGPTPVSGIPPLSLYTKAVGSTSGNIILFISGLSPERASGVMNLYIQGGTTPVEDTMPLYLIAPSGATSSLDLVLAGPSGADGYMPVESGINLFIKTKDGKEDNLPLFISAGLQSSGNIPLSIVGGIGVNNNIPLVIPNIVGQGSGNLKLYIRGF